MVELFFSENITFKNVIVCIKYNNFQLQQNNYYCYSSFKYLILSKIFEVKISIKTNCVYIFLRFLLLTIQQLIRNIAFNFQILDIK